MRRSAPALAREIRRRLGPARVPGSAPLVSIVVVNRDGLEHLRRLVAGLLGATDYPQLELVLVDNGSSDGSLDFARALRAPFPVAIVANRRNESFSVACNQGAARARGELLLLLNNDVEPFEAGWLGELVACLHDSGCGAAAATLVQPSDEHPGGWRVQHRGLRFRERDGLLEPALRDLGADPLDGALGVDFESAALAAACLLVNARVYDSVGGLSAGYDYGAEDVDFSFKLRAAGIGLVCCGRSVAIHRAGSTRAVDFERARARKLRNLRLLRERWGPRLRRECELDRAGGAGVWLEPGPSELGGDRAGAGEAETLSFCVRQPNGASDPQAVDALRATLQADGHRVVVLNGSAADDDRALECDVAIAVDDAAAHSPTPGRVNVLWTPAGARQSPHRAHPGYDHVTDGPPDELIAAALGELRRRRLPTRIQAEGHAAAL